MQLSHGPPREHRFPVGPLVLVSLLPGNGRSRSKEFTCCDMTPQQYMWKVKLRKSYRRMEWKNRDINPALELMGFKSVVGCHAYFRSYQSFQATPTLEAWKSVRWVHNKSVPSRDIIGNRFSYSEEIGKTSRNQFQLFLMVTGPSIFSSCVLHEARKKENFVVVRGNLKWAWKEVYFSISRPN